MGLLRVRIGLAVLWAAAVWTSPVLAQSTVDEDIDFAGGLVDLGFPDYAERLVDEIERANPAAKDRALMVRAKAATARGKLDEALKIVESMPKDSPKSQAALLGVGNSLYRMGQADRALDIYKRFFSQYGNKVPADPDLRKGYMDAAYRYFQMQMNAGDMDGATQTLENMLAGNPDDEMKRPLKMELAQLMVKRARRAGGAADKKSLLDRARKVCTDVQYGGIDLWFGQSVVTMAETFLMEGRRKEAQQALDSNKDILTQLDDVLKREEIDPSRSPIAGVRFIYGQLFEAEGRALKESDEKKAVALLKESLQHYVNVFAKYGDNPWAIEADSRAEEVTALLESMGYPVRIKWGEYRQVAIEARLRRADALFGAKEWEAAAQAYRQAIGSLPEGVEAGRPFHNLVMCHANLKDDLGVDVIVEHIAERHVKDATTGLAVIAAGRHYYENKQIQRCLEMYDLFVNSYPKHERVPQLLFVLAGVAQQQEKPDLQMKYLLRIVKEFPEDQYYLRAVSTLGWVAYGEQNYPMAEGHFRKFIELSPPSHARALAQFSLADSLVRQKKFDAAVLEFRKLRDWLTPTDRNPYFTTAAEIKKSQEMKDQSGYMTAFCLTQIQEPAADVPKIRDTAIKELQTFIEANPTSEVAPKCMNLIGAIHLEMGRMDEATKVFDELQKRYPASEEGKNALYSLIKAALDVNKVDLARNALNGMVTDATDAQGRPRYSVEQYALVGQRFLDAKLYEEAAKAFAKVVERDSPSRAVMENTLYGYGVASFETGNHTNAILQIEDLLKRYPRTAHYYKAKLVLSRSYRSLNPPNFLNASKALADIFSTVNKDAVMANSANIEYAQVQEEAARRAPPSEPERRMEFLKAALGSYQRVVLLADETNDKLKPLIEQSMFESIRLMEETGDFARAITTCEEFLKKYPDSARNADVRQRMGALRLKAPPPAPAPAPAAGGGR